MEVKLVKLQTYDLSLFIGQSYFINDGTQLYLILQPVLYFKKTCWYWKKFYHEDLNGNVPTEKLNTPTINGNSLSSSIEWY